jgi:hypothetical protein
MLLVLVHRLSEGCRPADRHGCPIRPGDRAPTRRSTHPGLPSSSTSASSSPLLLLLPNGRRERARVLSPEQPPASASPAALWLVVVGRAGVVVVRLAASSASGTAPHAGVLPSEHAGAAFGLARVLVLEHM